MKAMIAAGAAGVHFEDQLSSEKKCGHLGGKVLIPTQQAVRHLVAARLAADVMDVPTIVVARTDAGAAKLITSDVDPVDRAFTDRRTHRRGILRHAPRFGGVHRARFSVRSVRGFDLDGNVRAKSRRSAAFRRSHSQRVSRQAAGIQLFAVVQLEEETRRTVDRNVPRTTQRDGLQVSVHHAGRLPRAQLQLLPPGARL